MEEAKVEEKEEVQQPVEEFSIDLDNLPKQNHRWVDRGTYISCEGAGHLNHRHHKR